VDRPQGGQPAAVFFPLGYPFPYGPALDTYKKYGPEETALGLSERGRGNQSGRWLTSRAILTSRHVTSFVCHVTSLDVMDRSVWQGVSTVSLKIHPGPPCTTLLHPVGGPPPKRPFSRFWGGPPAGPSSTPWISHAIRAWSWDIS
jgi:hypothetical protein